VPSLLLRLISAAFVRFDLVEVVELSAEKISPQEALLKKLALTMANSRRRTLSSVVGVAVKVDCA